MFVFYASPKPIRMTSFVIGLRWILTSKQKIEQQYMKVCSIYPKSPKEFDAEGWDSSRTFVHQ